jgi:acyl dehydratase
MAHNNIHTFSYGYDKLRFIKPVFDGDTIYTIRTQLEKWPRYPEMGMVRASYEIFKMPEELILYCEHLQTVKYRDPHTLRMSGSESKSQWQLLLRPD